MSHYPTPPRNPALDPFRGRDWSRVLNPPKARRGPRKRAFVITRDTRNFAVVATDVIAADNRVAILYP